jgi:hypothetical protein
MKKTLLILFLFLQYNIISKIFYPNNSPDGGKLISEYNIYQTNLGVQKNKIIIFKPIKFESENLPLPKNRIYKSPFTENFIGLSDVSLLYIKPYFRLFSFNIISEIFSFQDFFINQTSSLLPYPVNYLTNETQIFENKITVLKTLLVNSVMFKQYYEFCFSVQKIENDIILIPDKLEFFCCRNVSKQEKRTIGIRPGFF